MSYNFQPTARVRAKCAISENGFRSKSFTTEQNLYRFRISYFNKILLRKRESRGTNDLPKSAKISITLHFWHALIGWPVKGFDRPREKPVIGINFVELFRPRTRRLKFSDDQAKRLKNICQYFKWASCLKFKMSISDRKCLSRLVTRTCSSYRVHTRGNIDNK